MEHSHLKQFDPFRSSFGDLLGRTIAFLRLGLIVFHSRGRTLSHKDFQSGCGNGHQSWLYVSTGHNYSYSFQVVLSLVTDCFSHVCTNKYSADYLKGIFCRSPGFSDPCHLHCPMNSNHLGLSASFSQPREFSRFLLIFPFLVLQPRNSFKALR